MSDPTLPPPAPTELFTEPAPSDPVTFGPPVVDVPSDSLISSSSESSEAMAPVGRRPQHYHDLSSSEEETGGPLARRPPHDFRYNKSNRRKRQALEEVQSQPKPPHTPVFLSDFPSGASPFRSCPGPARYTTA